jgi:hypothetical protein
MVVFHYCVTRMEHMTVNNIAAFYRPSYEDWRPSLFPSDTVCTKYICYECHVVRD